MIWETDYVALYQLSDGALTRAAALTASSAVGALTGVYVQQVKSAVESVMGHFKPYDLIVEHAEGKATYG
jgi:hypothetical protein